MSAYEELKAWLEALGMSTISQSVSIEDGVATVEEDGVDEVSSIVLDDIYALLGLKDAPWLIEIDEGGRKVVKFPVGP